MSPTLVRPIVFSILAAIATIGMKTAAYWLTGSVGLLSDALESGVNLLAGVLAAFSLWYASKPADAEHTYGHEKIEFFSSGFEGALIFVAGGSTIYYAILRLINIRGLEELNLGMLIAMAASAINAVTGWILIKVGKREQSLILTANGKHLLTDVLTTFGVVIGLAMVKITQWAWLDSIVALAVGFMIISTAIKLIRDAFDGLMDRALPDSDQAKLRELIQQSLPPGSAFHGLRTRRAGKRILTEMHLLLPGKISLADAHAAAHQLEAIIQNVWPDLEMTIHQEPIEEPSSFEPRLAQIETSHG